MPSGPRTSTLTDVVGLRRRRSPRGRTGPRRSGSLCSRCSSSFAVLNCSHCTTKGCRVSFFEDRVIELARPAAPLGRSQNWKIGATSPTRAMSSASPSSLEQIERRRMRGGGARIGLRAVVLVEQPHRQAAASEQPGAQQPDRAAARDQDAPVINAHGDSSTSSARLRSCSRRSSGSRTAGSRCRT